MQFNLFRQTYVVLLFSLLCLFTVTESAFSDLEPPYLFEIIQQPSAMSSRAEPSGGANRIRVSANIQLIRPGAISSTEFTLLMPDQKMIIAEKRVTDRARNSWTWFGKVKGDELSSVVLTVVDGVMNGKIVTQNASYIVEPDGADYVIIKEDSSYIKTSPDDYLIPMIEHENLPYKAAQAYSTTTESGEYIDVLVLYTQQFYTKYSSQLASKIQHAIDIANEAFNNSGINTQLRLVHSALFTDSQASESAKINDVLYYITGTTGSCSSFNPPAPPETISSLREQYKADIVALFRVYQGGGSCGLSWILKKEGFCNPYYAFNVTDFKSASEGYYYCSDTSFAHEIGHLLGGDHDRRTGCSQGFYPYSCGYGIDNQFVTIMAYETSFTKANTILYYSNPAKSYNGFPTGVSSNDPNGADNAKTFNDTRRIVANYRVASDTTCTYSIDPTSQSFTAAGGFGSVSVSSSSPTCTWTATSNNSWLSITSGSSGTGDGIVEYSVAANTGSISRTGTLTIAGKTLSVSQSGTSNSQYLDEVQKIYIAYYGRPADPDGQDYWTARLADANGDLSQIIMAFGTSNEFTERYGGFTNDELIDTIYQQMFSRNPDEGGKEYYLYNLNNGLMKLQTITLDVLNGAQNSDLITINNKLEVANYFTEKVRAGCTYDSEQIGVYFLSGITSSTTTVAQAKAGIDSYCQAF
ncbi:MAG: DUF4214 domain-containing protein [Deltaproteobacteria bacterium]